MDKVIKYAHIIDGDIFGTAAEAEEAYPLSRPARLKLREGQNVVDGRIVELVTNPDIEYKVTWNTQEIPFWKNFEGAKACVLAINTNKNGSRARLVSFMREKEVRL